MTSSTVPPRFRPLLALLGEQPALSGVLYALGALGVGIAGIALAAHVGGTLALGTKKSALFIAGADAIIAALVLSTPRVRARAVDLPALIAGTLDAAVFGAALLFAADIALLDQSKTTERFGYFVAALVVVPAAVALTWRRERKPGRPASVPAAVALLTTTAVTVLVVHAVGPSSTSAVLLIALLLTRIVAVAVLRVVPLPVRSTVAPAAVPLILVAAAISVLPGSLFTPGRIAIAAVIAGASAAALSARPWPVAIPRPAVDVVLAGLLGLAVLYLGAPSLNTVLNDNYFLGPVLDVQGGHPMLVGVFSQYGVGLYDVFAGIFSIVPIGYGTFSLLIAILTTLLYIAIYAVLRLSTRSIPLAAAGACVIAAVSVFGQIATYTDFPSTGVLRFGAPWLVLLLTLIAVQRSSRRLAGGVLAVVAGATAWSGEAGVYATVTAAALALIASFAADLPAAARVRLAAIRIAQVLAAAAGGVIIFTLLTAVLAGAWPDWTVYLDFVRKYTTGGLGAIPIAAWSPGLGIATLYISSAAAVLSVTFARPDLVRERLTSWLTIGGLTALGTMVFTYYLGRAHPNNLVHISPPAIALVFAWLGLLRQVGGARLLAPIATFAVIGLGVLGVAAEHATIGAKFPYTALAGIFGHQPGLGTEVRTLWDNPPVTPSAPVVTKYVRSVAPGRTPIVVLLTQPMESETLLRLGRSNAAGTSDPCQESFSKYGAAHAEQAVRALRPGTVLVIGAANSGLYRMMPIQYYTLALIRARFRLVPLRHGPEGIGAFRLVSRAVPGHSGPAPRDTILTVGCA